MVLWRLGFYLYPKFWKVLWKETRRDCGTKFAVWLTLIAICITLLITGLIGLLSWVWPPSILVIIAFLLGMWAGSKGWWDKINQ